VSKEGAAVPSANVAIVMRTRNRPVLLERAVRDVLKQSYRDWVLLIVNDGGSRPEVDDVVRRYSEAAGGRIHVLHNAESAGMEAASNQGIRATGSVYLAVHDDDDEWRPDFLETTLGYLEDSADQGVMVRTEIVYERVDGDRIEVTGREIFAADVHEITLFDLLRYNRGVPISFLYRRSVHDAIGYYDETLPAVGDWEFHLRFLREYSIGFIDGEPRAYWNQRREATGDLGNSVISRDEEHRKYDLLVRERYLKEYADKHGLGALLYLTKLQDRHVHDYHQRTNFGEARLQEIIDSQREMNDRLERLEAAVSDASLVSLLRRRYRRLKGRILRG
jgi:glycosyltransferase involved in cell wall biosynthesis